MVHAVLTAKGLKGVSAMPSAVTAGGRLGYTARSIMFELAAMLQKSRRRQVGRSLPEDAWKVQEVMPTPSSPMPHALPATDLRFLNASDGDGVGIGWFQLVLGGCNWFEQR